MTARAAAGESKETAKRAVSATEEAGGDIGMIDFTDFTLSVLQCAQPSEWATDQIADGERSEPFISGGRRFAAIPLVLCLDGPLLMLACDTSSSVSGWRCLWAGRSPRSCIQQ